jgi:acetyl-CoA carboxylase biotin carboxyl carrier protein
MAIFDLVSEVAGTVWKVSAQVGQMLVEDDPVLIVESMKMEIPVPAPEDCQVLEILLSEGDMVSLGTVLARLQVD